MDRYFEGESFDEQDTLTIAEGEYINCTFEGVDFSGKSFKSSKLIECTFKKCNMSNITLLNATMMNCEFIQCKLLGMNWTSTNRINNPIFTSCVLDLSIMQEIDLSRINFTDCSIRDVDFSGSLLVGSIFKECNLENSIFNQCDLSNTNFSTAVNYWIDPQYNKLKGSKFSMPEAINLFKAMEIEIE